MRKVALLSVLLLVAAACGGGDEPATTAPRSSPSATERSSPPPTPEPEPEPEYVAVNKAKEGDLVKIAGDPGGALFGGVGDVRSETAAEIAVKPGFIFSPTIIYGSPGQKVKLTILGQKDVPDDIYHSFNIDEVGLEKIWRAPNSIDVTVTFPKEGAQAFYCKFHVKGPYLMAGELRVRT